MIPKTDKTVSYTLASTDLLDAYTDFMLSRQAMLCTAGTIRWYSLTAGKFLEWLESQGVTSPDEVTARFVRAYLAEKAAKLKDSTLNGHARAIKTLLLFWHAEGYISEVVKFSMPKIDDKRQPFLDAGQLEKAIKACKKPRDRVLIMLLADSGVRRAEVLALNWGDIDIPSGLVRVRRGKGGKARSVVVGAKTRRVLLAYRRTLENRDDEDPLIQSDEGMRLTNEGSRSALLRIGKRAGVHITAHMLRRTFATLTIKSGMNLLHVQALLGHSTLEMTKKYAQWVTDDLVESHQKFGAIDNLNKLK